MSRTLDLSSIDSERRNTILAVGGISLVVLVAILIVAYGFYTDKLASSNDTVVIVGNQHYKYNYVERRIVDGVSSSDLASSNAFSSYVTSVLSSIEHQGLILDAARSQGIEVSHDELDAEIRTELGLSQEVAPETVASVLASHLLETGDSLSQFENSARAKVIEAKLRDQLGAQVPAQAEQVDIRLLKVASEARALQLKQELDNGADMAGIVTSDSIDPSQSSAGELGWIPKGTMETDLEDKIFSQQVGTISDVIEEPDGFYIIHLRGKETRDVDDAAKQRVIDYALTQVIDHTRDAVGSSFLLTQTQLQQIAVKAQAAVRPTGG